MGALSLRRRAHPDGFTFIELLVCLSIASILFGLTLPALEMAHESANRTACMNNLKQLGLAVHQYHGVYNKLPPCRLDNQGGLTWAVLLLPYLEQDDYYRMWNLHLPYYLHSDAVRKHEINVFECPSLVRYGATTSTAESATVNNDDDGPGSAASINPPGGRMTYAVCAGDDQKTFRTADADGAVILAQFQLDKNGRLLSWMSLTSFQSITDGLSNTLLIGDKYIPFGLSTAFHYGDSSAYNGNRPNVISRVAGPKNLLAKSTTARFRNNFGSFHPGLCNFVYADGSVHSLSTETDGTILGLLANRSDGLSVSEP